MHGRKTGFARTALRIVNRLARPLDKLAASNATGQAAPIMVVGLPRSGTTLAYELLVQAFDVSFLTRIYSYAYGLPNLATRVVARGIRDPDARYSSNYGRIPGRYAPAENGVIWDRWFPEHEELGHHVPIDAITTTAQKDAAAMLSSMSTIAGRPFVFKNLYMTLSLPAYLQLLPKSKVIIVTRDIDTIIASVYNKRKKTPSWWAIRPPFTGDVRGRSVLDQTAYQCIRSQQLLEHSLSTLPSDRFKVVDYATICAEPQIFIDDVASWAGSGLERRPGHEIPQQFDISGGPGLSGELEEQLAELTETLESSGSQYLSRIQAFVATPSTGVVG